MMGSPNNKTQPPKPPSEIHLSPFTKPNLNLSQPFPLCEYSLGIRNFTWTSDEGLPTYEETLWAHTD